MAAGHKTGGRQKGSVNKTTALMKDAITAVYADLQDSVEESDNPNAHFFEWAKSNETEFYKLASKLLPLQINGELTLNSHEQALDALR